MHRRHATIAFLVFGPIAAASGIQTYRLSAIDVSSLPEVYSVLDSRVAEKKDLVAGDFRLLEDGKATATAATTKKFRATGMGLAVVVAIDASRSMNGRPLTAVRQGLAQLVSRRRDRDRVSILTFANDIRWETRWDTSAATIHDVFRNIATRGDQTRLYDAISTAMDELAAQAREDSGFPRRMSILVLSDGHDEGSSVNLEQIEDRLGQSRVRLDAVGLAHSQLWLRNLSALATAGFGRFRPANSAEALTNLLGQEIDDLLNMPALEFHAQDVSRDGKSHQFGVEDLPTHWRDQLAAVVPDAAWRSQWTLWAAGAGLIVVLGLALGMFSHRRSVKPQVVARALPAAVPMTPDDPQPVKMTETFAEAVTIHPANPKQEDVTGSSPASPVVRRGTKYMAPSATLGPGDVLITSGPHAGTHIPLSADEFWIGSAANNHLCLSSDPAVSGNHACIRNEKGVRRLYDNGSLNNTFVNGRPIGREVVLLTSGDRIRAGQSEMVIEF
jgi:uncharacterized protein YegL